MNKLFRVLLLGVLAAVAIWTAYAFGYGRGLRSGINQQYSSTYASASVQLKVLELINDAETQRAEKALRASIVSDISFLNELKAAKGEIKIGGLLLGSFSALTQETPVYHSMADQDVKQLEARLRNINPKK